MPAGNSDKLLLNMTLKSWKSIKKIILIFTCFCNVNQHHLKLINECGFIKFATINFMFLRGGSFNFQPSFRSGSINFVRKGRGGSCVFYLSHFQMLRPTPTTLYFFASPLSNCPNSWYERATAKRATSESTIKIFNKTKTKWRQINWVRGRNFSYRK